MVRVVGVEGGGGSVSLQVFANQFFKNKILKVFFLASSSLPQVFERSLFLLSIWVFHKLFEH